MTLEGLLHYETQYNIDNYRIDLYLKDIGVAIECDELEHRNKQFDDIEREKYIKNKLKCEFIRFNPYDKDFNIGNIINAIFRKLIDKK